MASTPPPAPSVLSDASGGLPSATLRCRVGIHPRVLTGGGMMGDCLTCVDCARDKYPESFGVALKILPWPKGRMIDRTPLAALRRGSGPYRLKSMADNPILFRDIDGVLIPGRAYFMANQTQPLISTFDPCVVGMINRVCRDFDARLVIHSNWRNTEPRRIEKGLRSLPEHFVNQGILAEYFHHDPLCPKKMSSSRWHDICLWLEKYPAVRDSGNFLVLEDTAHPADWEHASQVVQTDFDEGLTVSQYLDIRTRLGRYTGRRESGLLLPNSLITPGGG